MARYGKSLCCCVFPLSISQTLRGATNSCGSEHMRSIATDRQLLCIIAFCRDTRMWARAQTLPPPAKSLILRLSPRLVVVVDSQIFK